jgi:hypothetical protein
MAFKKKTSGTQKAPSPSPSLPPSDNPVRLPDGRFRCKYNLVSTDPIHPWLVDLMGMAGMFNVGIDRYTHLRRAIDVLQPGAIWHEWREERFRTIFDDEYAHRVGGVTIRNISWVGPGAGGKTFDAGVFAYHYWLADPLNTAVILTTTSKGKLKQRVWPVISECYYNGKRQMDADGVAGQPHMVNSLLELRCTKEDAKHAIFGQAVEAGEVGKAVEKLKGVHAPRMLVVIDEAPGTEEAVFKTIPNMLKGCREFILLNIGNGPITHLDSFSKICTPLGGWKSITVDSDRWVTKPVPEFQLPRGVCLHFDGVKSPNVKAGRTLFPFLYTWENWQQVKDNEIIQRTPEFWSQDRGFWPPEGFVNTVLTEELIEQGDARGAVEFTGKTTPIGSIDPGFGGDACKLRFGRLGKLGNGKRAVQIDESLTIPILVDEVDENGKKVPAEYQIARRVIDECGKRSVRPEFFGVEATGTGRGIAAVLIEEFGEIIAVESGGRASDLPASEEDNRPSREVYDRRITELWFSVRSFVIGKQLGGLSEDDVIQFCARKYDFVSKKYILETKPDLKVRLGRSPDDADSVAVLIEVARRHGMATIGARTGRMSTQLSGLILTQTKLYSGVDYSPEVPA